MSTTRQVKKLLKAVIPSRVIKIAKRAQVIIRLSKLDPETATSLVGQSENLTKHYPSIGSAEEIVHKYQSLPGNATKSLDLGCGANTRNPFEATEALGVDIRSDLSGGIKQADLATDSIPFSENFFDFCTAFDVLEHIPRNTWKNGTNRPAFLELMNEIHRVLKPGGLFLHSTPAFPSKQAFQDPTHVNIITEDTMPYYFCEPYVWAKTLGYGFTGRFELVEQKWVQGIWLVGIMRALK